MCTKKNVQISFIIPAYNAEKVLRRAVESIVGVDCEQKNIEVLIVENGSTDETLSVAKQLQREYPNIRCMQSNKGVSCARNKGIRNAKGKWIVFIDADDYLIDNALNILEKDIQEESTDLLLYGYESGNKIVNIRKASSRDRFEREHIEDCRIMMLESPTLYMQVWAKAFRREVMLENNIFFNEDICLSEDSDFTLRYTKKCSCISFYPDIVYHYSLEASSTMRTYQGNKVDKYRLAMLETQKYVFLEPPNIQETYKKYVLMHLNIALVRDVFCVENRHKFNKKICYMKQVAQIDIFRQAISEIKLRDCCSVRMLPILLLKWHCYWCSGIIYQLRAWQNYLREA